MTELRLASSEQPSYDDTARLTLDIANTELNAQNPFAWETFLEQSVIIKLKEIDMKHLNMTLYTVSQ